MACDSEIVDLAAAAVAATAAAVAAVALGIEGGDRGLASWARISACASTVFQTFSFVMCLPFDQRFDFVFTPFPGFAHRWRCLVWSRFFVVVCFVFTFFFVWSGFRISFCLVWSGLSSRFVSPGLVFHLILSRLIWFVIWLCLDWSGFSLFCFVLSGLSSGFVSSALSDVFSYLFWFLIWRTLFFD